MTSCGGKMIDNEEEKNASGGQLPNNADIFVQESGHTKEKRRKNINEGLGEIGRRKRLDNLYIAFAVVTMILIIACIIFATNFKISNIVGDSMMPTLNDGDSALICRFVGKIERGDIVTFIREDTDGRIKNIIKRVVGLPGDRVQILPNGEVMINGEILEEDYLEFPVINDANSWDIVLKSSEYFVLGDNRDISYDSEDYGPIHRAQIKGIFVRVL